ncbi:MAG: hypothetical protein ACTSVO_07130 [Candidatus Heimdallarchaeaceae archaeon]
MGNKTEKAIASIPKITPKQDAGITTLNFVDLLTEKPRASIKEIDATKRLIKMLDSKKKYSYNSKNSSSK